MLCNGSLGVATVDEEKWMSHVKRRDDLAHVCLFIPDPVGPMIQWEVT